VSVLFMASPIERNATAGVAARQSIMPTMPHIDPTNLLLRRFAIVVAEPATITGG
jgi:hypothetical protein